MKTLDQIALNHYGKTYKQLPDDGAEQDHVQSIFARQTQAWEIIKAGDIEVTRQGAVIPCVGIWDRNNSTDICFVHAKNTGAARLISATPELLAALEAALPFLPLSAKGAKDVLHPALSQARAAIAKAKGAA